MLNLCGGDGAPFRVGGEWLMPLLNAVGVKDTGLGPPGFIGGRGGMMGGEALDCIFTSTGDPGIAGTLFSQPTANKEREVKALYKIIININDN